MGTCQVGIHCGGAAHDPSIHNLLQIANVNSVEIRWVSADLISQIISPSAST